MPVLLLLFDWKTLDCRALATTFRFVWLQDEIWIFNPSGEYSFRRLKNIPRKVDQNWISASWSSARNNPFLQPLFSDINIQHKSTKQKTKQTNWFRQGFEVNSICFTSWFLLYFHPGNYFPGRWSKQRKSQEQQQIKRLSKDALLIRFVSQHNSESTIATEKALIQLGSRIFRENQEREGKLKRKKEGRPRWSSRCRRLLERGRRRRGCRRRRERRWGGRAWACQRGGGRGRGGRRRRGRGGRWRCGCCWGCLGGDSPPDPSAPSLPSAAPRSASPDPRFRFRCFLL